MVILQPVKHKENYIELVVFANQEVGDIGL